MKSTLLLFSICFLGSTACLSAETASPLFAAGYTVLPSPQKVVLYGNDIQFTQTWRLDSHSDDAKAQLTQLLAERFHLALHTATLGSSATGVVRLKIAPNTVAVPNTDETKSALAEQAYRLTISPHEITVTGNTAAGLFYGIETLAQLLKEQSGMLWLPESTIEDWPDVELRVIYWDDAHHLEPLNILKAAIRQASFYKINGFALKLEGHFQYTHASAIVDPYALTPSELQELTDYGLKHHVQLIPYLDGPAHVAFILKHPEYAKLREFPDSNYEFCATNPDTYKLFEGMFQDLLDANKGVKYFVLSTDEPYYVGLANNAQCHEADRTKELGSVGKMLAEFATKTSAYLHDHGRTVIFWGEYPLKPEDIGALPGYLVNGELYGPKFDPVFRAHSIRQMVYTSTQAEESLFPQYYGLPDNLRIHAPATDDSKKGRVQDMLDGISSGWSATAQKGGLLGVFIAGWGDAGLHPETFWLGYATGPAAGWNRNHTDAKELQSSFYSLFYGQGSIGMGRVYQLMSQGAQSWEDAWETGPSSARKPIWGDSSKQFFPPQPARDQHLSLLPVPSAELLRLDGNWRAENTSRLQLASTLLTQNEELTDLLYANVHAVQFNRYNLSVYLSISNLYRHNLTMLQSLGRISDLLKQAEQSAAKVDAAKALESVDQALDLAEEIRRSRNTVLQDATNAWYQSWLPRVSEANGRSYLDEVDDVKDHKPVRTIDMSYLVYRELLYPLGDWAKQVVTSRNKYATAHNLPVREFTLNWKDVSAKAAPLAIQP